MHGLSMLGSPIALVTDLRIFGSVIPLMDLKYMIFWKDFVLDADTVLTSGKFFI